MRRSVICTIFWAASSEVTAHAATITVTTTDDQDTTDGNCSIREAVLAASLDMARDACPAGSGNDTVVVPSGTFILTSSLGLNVQQTMTVVGAGADSTIIDGNLATRIFETTTAGIMLTLEGVTIRNGRATNGGAILANGPIQIEDCVFDNNEATSSSPGYGGAIYGPSYEAST